MPEDYPNKSDAHICKNHTFCKLNHTTIEHYKNTGAGTVSQFCCSTKYSPECEMHIIHLKIWRQVLKKARLAHASIHKMKSVWLFYPKSFHMSVLAQESAFMGNSLEIIASHINQSRWFNLYTLSIAHLNSDPI